MTRTARMVIPDEQAVYLVMSRTALDGFPIGSVGENMYMEMGLDSTPETAIQAWADEARDYDYANATCPSDKECGHYTQLVWRESIKVGCAMVFCPSVANSNFTNADLYVCDYAPAGNWNERKPY